MKKAVMLTIADNNNLKHLPMLEASLRKFHSKDELPLVVIGQAELDKNPDPQKFYRAAPYYALQYIKDYELVLKIDVDSIITSSLDHILSDKAYDVGVVLNSNPREVKKWVVNVWDILPAEYYNCGFVAMRNEEFILHWLQLCTSKRFEHYQYKEQDLLNILCHYGNYKVKCFDYSHKFHGLASNSYWPYMYVKEDRIFLKQTKDETAIWPPDEDKEIVILHFGEGQQNTQKGNFRLKCSEDVINKLDELTDYAKRTAKA